MPRKKLTEAQKAARAEKKEQRDKARGKVLFHKNKAKFLRDDMEDAKAKAKAAREFANKKKEALDKELAKIKEAREERDKLRVKRKKKS